MISHDRFFLNSVCDDLWLVHNNHVSTFQGDLDDYRQWLLSQSSPKHKPSKPTKPKSASPLKQQQQLTKQLNQLECQHDELHQAVKTLDEQLADPQLYQSADHRQSQSLNQQRQTLITQIAQLEQQVLTLMEKLT